MTPSLVRRRPWWEVWTQASGSCRPDLSFTREFTVVTAPSPDGAEGNRILIWMQQPASEFAVAEVEYVGSSKD